MITARIVDYDEYSDQIRNIRIDVFCREQGVPHSLEFDGLDSAAIHSIALDGDFEIGTGRMLSDGHLTAYFEYKDLKRREALNHLFVADKYDHENVKNSLAKIDNSDYESIRSFTMK